MAGQSNAQLTKEGIQQAKEVGRTYRSYSWDAVFTSDLDRCMDTARYVVGSKHPENTWIKAEELRERYSGQYEGQPYAELRKILPPRKYKLWQRDFYAAPPGGESFNDVQKRVVEYAKQFIFPTVNDGKRVIVVTHCIPVMVLIGYIKNLSEEQILQLKVENAMPYVLPYGKVRE
jgi:broad specificity phosphatase PhoE